MWFEIVFATSTMVCILAGATATWLVTVDKSPHPSRAKLAMQLARIAVMGALAIFALLGTQGI